MNLEKAIQLVHEHIWEKPIYRNSDLFTALQIAEEAMIWQQRERLISPFTVIALLPSETTT